MKDLFCPLCGTKLEVDYIGNEHTKSRKIHVECPVCRIERTDGAIRRSFEELEVIVAEFWSRHLTQPPHIL